MNRREVMNRGDYEHLDYLQEKKEVTYMYKTLISGAKSLSILYGQQETKAAGRARKRMNRRSISDEVNY
jgi:hypothetical protein